jgi:BASS family bile acid:Na+ symporter
MTPLEWILWATKTSVVVYVLGIGLGASWLDATFVLRRPELLARSLLAMGVAMPVLALMLVVALPLHSVVEVAVVALSVSPVPALFPRRARAAADRPSYAIGLLVAASALCLVTAPLTLGIVDRVFGAPVRIPAGAIATTVLVTVVVPLAAGMLVRRAAPRAASFSRAVCASALSVLAACLALVLVHEWPLIVELARSPAVVAMALFAAAGLAVGHVAGGPARDERAVLALASCSRHPGVAIAIGVANAQDARRMLAAVLLYLLVVAAVIVPCAAWMRRRREGTRAAVHGGSFVR